MQAVNLDMKFYSRIAPIQWLSRCGDSSRPDLELPVQWVEDRAAALRSLFSPDWAGVNTHAMGQLTSYLAKSDYDTYGTTWNKLAKQSEAVLKGQSGEHRLQKALEAGGWPESLAHTPLPPITPGMRAALGKQMADWLAAKAWDQCLSALILRQANLAALEVTYHQRFPGAPVFFDRLLRVYESGRLPCGWDGDLEVWPAGALMVH